MTSETGKSCFSPCEKVGIVSAGKYTPAAVSNGVDITEVSGCHLLGQMNCQWGSQNWLQGLVSHELTAYIFLKIFVTEWIMVILSKGCKPDNFEPHNSLKLSFTDIGGLHSNFVECESFLESNSLVIFALC